MVMDFTGKVFGSYKLLALVGWGGYANVYRGVHFWLRTPVAVKVLNIQVDPRDREAVRQSLQEALIANYLKHAHIIQILDCGIQHGIPYIVMPYMQNGSLRQVHGQHAQLPWDTIIDYVRQVTKALTFIHSRNLIHQDVKPENMLLADDGTLLLSDFGTAGFIESTGTHYPQAPIGTVSFMAPERFTDAVQTPASDVYSLGMVVYLWLTGDLPFHGTKSEIIDKHLYTPLPTRPLTAMGIDPAIQRVLLTALAKNPRDRYQSVLEFYKALKNAKMAADQTQRVPTTRRRTRPNRRLFRWGEMSIIFFLSMFTSPLPPVVCYIRGVQIGTDVLIWLICLSLLSFLGILICKNWLALRFVFAAFAVAVVISFLTQSWPIFCLAFYSSLLLSTITGFLKGYYV